MSDVGYLGFLKEVGRLEIFRRVFIFNRGLGLLFSYVIN